tara:strand:+ start:609 stop:1415 length:807 start_codon:yes stop_codon:yes gene_type:complete
MNYFFIKLILLFFLSTQIFANDNKIIIASTTSTYDSGLLSYLNDTFKKKYKINVQVLSLGTGQAIRTAKDGNVEILLVHHKESELKFIDQGYGIKRYDIMYNDYVIVGPKNDKSKCLNIKDKLEQIIDNGLTFISRGDDSGTHKKELELWDLINIKPRNIKNSHYLSIGQGMGNTLLIANEKFAYTLSDRGTWISFNKKENLKIICENKPPLFNQYGIILVNPIINNNLNFVDASIYVNWLLSKEGENLINNFKKNGKQLFFYNYNRQ